MDKKISDDVARIQRELATGILLIDRADIKTRQIRGMDITIQLYYRLDSKSGNSWCVRWSVFSAAKRQSLDNIYILSDTYETALEAFNNIEFDEVIAEFEAQWNQAVDKYYAKEDQKQRTEESIIAQSYINK